MVLFHVSSHAMLICAINVKIQMLGDVEADLHLDDQTDFSPILDRLKASGLFRHIEYVCNFRKRVEDLKDETRKAGKQFIEVVPDIWRFEHESDYSDVYFGHDMVPSKWYYYYLVQKGMRPKIHILDEGLAAYYKDIRVTAKYDLMEHKKFKAKAYHCNIEEQLLYLPEAYMLTNVNWSVTQIPTINDTVKNILLKLYNVAQDVLPDSKYIYLAMDGYEDNFFHNDIDLITKICKIVGKDNVVIKQHPRYRLDIYSSHGFHLWKDETGIPFEVLMLMHDSTRQVFISQFSTAAITSQTILGRKQYSIMLYNLFLGTPRYGTFGSGDKASHKFINHLKKVMNRENKIFFVPNNEIELEEILKYFNGYEVSEGKAYE